MQEILKNIESLFLVHGNEAYYGELVSQYDHAAQCYLLAAQEGASLELKIACFLHDIGHMLSEDDDGYGRMDHDLLGAQWLSKNGFGELIVATVLHHVNAKRYLCFKNTLYFDTLSDASKYTLSKQGGIMNSEQADEFEKHRFFSEIVRLRQWDEQAKKTEIELPELTFFLTEIENYLK